MRFVVLVWLVVLAVCGEASASWRAPVQGPVVGRFAVGPDPFAAGQRRGVDLAAPSGARVVAPCGGRVVFAGAVPGFGVGVSIRCGALTATVLGLGGGGLAHAGEAVARGEAIGVVGSGGRVRLGARVTRLRFGYRDPLSLLGDEPGARVPPVGPRGGRPRRPAAPSVSPPVAAPPPVSAPQPAAPRRGGAPVLAWVGVALVACALPGGAIAWRVRRRSVPVARSRASRWS